MGIHLIVESKARLEELDNCHVIETGTYNFSAVVEKGKFL